MNKVIILDGPDNIGKTTLIKELQEEYTNAIVVHYGAVRTKTEGKKVLFDALNGLKNMKDKLFIFDRSPFGEFVYGKIYRKYDPFSYWDVVVSLMKEIDTWWLHILFYADKNTYKKFGIQPKVDEKKSYQKADQAENVAKGYLELLNKCDESFRTMQSYVVHCNSYNTLNQRNLYVKVLITEWLEGTFKL